MGGGSVISRLNSSEVKQNIESSQRFHFNSSELKQCSEPSQRYICFNHLCQGNYFSVTCINVA